MGKGKVCSLSLCPFCSYCLILVVVVLGQVCRLAPSECREVQLNEDGSWTPVLEDKDKESGRKRGRHASDSDDSDEEKERKRKKDQSEKDKQEVRIYSSHIPLSLFGAGREIPLYQLFPLGESFRKKIIIIIIVMMNGNS